MYDRFTNNSKSAMNKAREQSQRLNQECLGTEHILLGLLEVVDCRAIEMLELLKVPRDRLRSEIEQRVQPGPTLVGWGQLPFTPGAKNVLVYSMEEAGALGSAAIGTEHLLLGLVRETDGIASKALSACGLSLGTARSLAAELTGMVSVRTLEKAVEVLVDFHEPELAQRVRAVAKKYGSRR